ncbi:MAG: hypothetical protein DIU71_08495 [Proteobacteria bacterium]|nr:MAG: hypothetical protein DIU71_08495 [Pseudomonadota bacterium]
MAHAPHALRSDVVIAFVLGILAWVCSTAARGSDFVAQNDPFETVRAEFLDAWRSVTSGNAESSRDSEALRNYPLYPYLQAARIRRALPGKSAGPAAVDERAAAFLAYYGDEPVARELRRAWLENLAERGQWRTFLEHYVDDLASDALRCHSFTARIELGRTAGLVREISAQWLTPHSIMPCRRAFDWLRERGALTPALIEQRVRRALEARNLSFARTIAAELPKERAAPLLQWASLLANPQQGIDGLIANPDRSVDPDALLATWERFARTNPANALHRYEKLVRARDLDRRMASRLAVTLALALSWDRHPQTLKYFARVADEDLDDYALEWQARAALWAGDWPLAQRVIAAMSDELRGTSRWRYWSARAAAETRDYALARQLWRSILIDDNYYSAMAAARLGEPVQPTVQPLPRDPTRLAEIAQLPPLVRAQELLRSRLPVAATAEWSYGHDQLSEDARLQAIHLAAEWGWHDMAVATATRNGIFNDYTLLYPRPFDAEVAAAARLSKLQPELIYAVMRQESLYRPDAASSAGALGLLQLLPETARRTARAWNKPRPSRADLLDPAVNVPLGAAHLRQLLDRFDGQTIVALAGYNAGPGAATRWLPPHALDSDVWIENIPYNETRNYVQRILWHSVVFAWLSTGEPQATDTWIARIGPPAAAPTTLGMNTAP